MNSDAGRRRRTIGVNSDICHRIAGLGNPRGYSIGVYPPHFKQTNELASSGLKGEEAS